MTVYPNWFDITARPFFNAYLLPQAERELDILQIGAYIGDASLWILNNLPKAKLVDVDTWEGSDESIHKSFDWDDVFQVYVARTKPFIDRMLLYRGTSDSFFEINEQAFDVVYVDGDHMALTVLRDGINAFDVLRIGGFIAFDDYTWSSGRGPYYDPRPAIDAFAAVYRDYVQVIGSGEQLWLQKIGDPA